MSLKELEAKKIAPSTTTEHLTLKAWVDRHMMSSDGEYKMLQEELKTEVRQQTIDLQHDKDLGNYYLDAGDNARDDLKPKKRYAE